MNRPTEESAPADAALVKDLFGILLDAAEAKDEGDSSAPALEREAARASAEAPPAVRRAAERLLASHRRARTSLLVETFTAGGTPKQNAVQPTLPVPPPEIAGYRIGEEIGRGGFGIVYRAEQLVPVQRPVAIKLLRTEFATSETAARFRAESAMLARMNHEGIARVLDAGLDSIGRPFVVMELIDGLPLITYCEQKNLAVRERVALMIRVCDVVHHAHQRAVIHRDLKPANILVEEIDGHPRPRVIDFGIAKLLEGRPNDTVTRDGHRIGTPRYMSPEQRRGTDTADTRIDVFALGVLVCEALTGEVPFVESEERDRDDGSAPRTTSRATKPSSLAEAGGQAVAARARELRGDLDRIVLKAVAPDPALRYSSAAALAEDLRRYLSGKPVEATPPGWWYIARKFVARRKGTSAAVALAAISLTVGGAALLTGLKKATENNKVISDLLIISERERKQADAVASLLVKDVLESLSPGSNGLGEPRMREVLRRASEVSRETLSDQPKLQVELLQRVGVAQGALSDFIGAAASFRAAAEIGRTSGVLPIEAILNLQIDSLRSDMSAKQLEGIKPAIIAVANESARRLGEAHPTTLRARVNAAHMNAGPDAVAALRTVIESIEASGLTGDPIHLEGLQYLGAALAAQGAPEAIETFRRAVDLATAKWGHRHADTLELRLRLGEALHSAGRLAEAEPILLEVKDEALSGFGPSSVLFNRALWQLASLTLSEGRFDDAYLHNQALLETIGDRDLEETRLHAMCLEALGEAEAGIGYFSDASRTLRRAIEIRETIGEAAAAETMRARARRGEVMLELDQPADLVDVVLPIFEHSPPGDEHRIRAAITLADAYVLLYRQDEARDLIEAERRRLSPDSPHDARFANWLIDHAGD